MNLSKEERLKLMELVYEVRTAIRLGIDPEFIKKAKGIDDTLYEFCLYVIKRQDEENS